MSCDNSAINGMNPGMAGFIVAKKRVMELNDSMQQGIVYLLGAGPGDPGLMTVRGRELVEAAEVLVYDALSSAELLNWAPAACERIFVGKRASRHALPQEEINALLVKLGRAGKKVVRLKGGDPYVFGRGGEEADALHEAGVPFEVIPGITSAIAGPAYAGIPVTHRKYCTQFTVFTGHEDVNKKESSLDLKGIAGAQGTKIMLMGMQKLADVCEALTGYGQEPSTPAAAIQWATTGIQRTVTGTVRTLPAKVQKAGLGAPAVVVIGDVVKERDSLDWFEKLPLFGKRIVVTRTRAQAGELSVRLRRLGAEVLEMPTIRMAPPPTSGNLRKAWCTPIPMTGWCSPAPTGWNASSRRFLPCTRTSGASEAPGLRPSGPERRRSSGNMGWPWISCLKNSWRKDSSRPSRTPARKSEPLSTARSCGCAGRKRGA